MSTGLAIYTSPLAPYGIERRDTGPSVAAGANVLNFSRFENVHGLWVALTVIAVIKDCLKLIGAAH